MTQTKDLILPEIISVGIFDADLVFKDIKITPQRKVSVFEIEIPIKSEGVSYINREQYPVHKDHVLCAKPGQIRRTALPYKCYYVHMRLSDGLLCDRMLHTPDVFRIFQRSRYVNLFTQMITARCLPFDSGGILVQSKILELIYHLDSDARRYSDQHIPPMAVDNAIVSRALAFMDKNFSSKNTLKDIAREVNLSPIYFHKIFSHAAGVTPYQYLLEKRLRAAKDLILFSDRPLMEIAFDCGFTSQSYFNFVFKRELGVTPGQYKKTVYGKYPV